MQNRLRHHARLDEKTCLVAQVLTDWHRQVLRARSKLYDKVRAIRHKDSTKTQTHNAPPNLYSTKIVDKIHTEIL